MAMEKTMSSVLSKLMDIERPSLPHKSHGRRRVLSEIYLQNISLVTHRERSPLDFYDYEDESTMIVEGNFESKDAIQLSEGTSLYEGNSCVKTKLEERRRLSQDLIYDKQFEGFNMRGSTSSFSEFGLFSNMSSSYASALKRQKSSEAWIWPEKSRKNLEIGYRFCPPERVFSSPVRSKGENAQGRKKRSFYNDRESPTRDFNSAQGIAKQVTNQVKDSIWHRFTEVSKSGSRSERTENENESEETIMCLSSCLSSLENEAQKTKKEFAERWRTRKSTRNSATRYLSKPTLFPSAWIPRSRTRDLSLDRNWCLRHDSLQSDNSSRLDLNGPSLSDLENVEESNMLEEISSALDSFSERSPFSDIGSPTYHDALMENYVFQEGSCGSALKCCFFHPSLDSEQIIDEGIENMGTCIKLQREQLSSEASNCILMDDRASSFAGFCLKHQVKVKTSEPGSPVSSLEGPEACRCRPNSLAESNQIPSLANFLDNDIHGLQQKLQPTDSVSLESTSEGHEMVISSDGDNEGSGYREDPQIMKNTSENRDFSYLIEVLSESGFPTLNMEQWWCQGQVLNPLVFDSLEKKYGKQTFWARGERKLLYDRMNSGLMEIARSLDPTRSKTLARRFIPSQNQEFIEEELWALLMKQEEESKRRSSNKVMGMEIEWLEEEAYTYVVVEEIESLLLDELLEEFLSW